MKSLQIIRIQNHLSYFSLHRKTPHGLLETCLFSPMSINKTSLSPQVFECSRQPPLPHKGDVVYYEALPISGFIPSGPVGLSSPQGGAVP